MKWFNSSIGLAATHAAVYAQLILNGVEKGIHVFMVQIRDENHQPLPGVEVGDVGAKLGDHGIDTGYLRLRDVRVPRKHMLSKRQHISADGR
jgi:acyl-CoA oxidase